MTKRTHKGSDVSAPEREVPAALSLPLAVVHPAVHLMDKNKLRAGSPVLTLEQTAHYLQLSKAHLSNVIRGKVIGVPPLRSFSVGRRILFKREWIDDWLDASAREELGP